MKKALLFRLAVLLAAMMCALGAAAAEAYACYTSSITTLTFYYDSQRSSRTGTTYDLNTGDNDTGWDTDGTKFHVTKVIFDPSFAGARPTTTYDWFYDMRNLQSITGMSYLNTSEVTNMNYMFYGSIRLTSLDLSHFNTSKVTSMNSMFDGCTRLQTIYVGSGWSTAAVTASDYMFFNCTSLVGGQGTTWKSSNPTDKTYAHIDGGPSNPGYFTAATEAYACYTPSNTTLTFYYDSQRSSRTGTTYDLNTGDNVVGWETNVTKVVFDPSFASARPTSTYGWFYDMENLQTITGIEYLNTSEVTNMGHMFNSCIRLTSLDLSSFNTSKVTHMHQMFQFCYELTSLDLSSFNTAKVTDMHYMLDYCTNLRTIYVGNGWSTAAVTNSTSMFRNCTSLVGGQGTTYDANHIDKAYAHIDGGPSNPGYFTEWKEAYACYTPSNTTLTFYYDNQRSSRTGTTYDLNEDGNDTGWDTDGTKYNVTKVVFDPSFANARPTTTYGWFYYMQNLQSITGLSYLNTSEVTNMAGMFNSCFKLTSLDLSSFNTSKVTDMRAMFFNSNYLRTICVGNGWSTAAVSTSTNMFYNCTSLVGGQGTTWNSSNPTDKTYAHIDGGTSNPGYFTEWKEAYACYTPSNTTLTFYYDSQRSGRTGTTYDLNTGANDTDWDTDGTNANVTWVVFDPSFANARPTTTYDWFFNMQNLQSITGMEYLNTSEVTKMAYMFMLCTSLTSLDVSHFNTSKVTDMNSMFCKCSSLTSLDLSSFNTSKVTKMGWMFSNCSNLRTIYVGSGWSTAAVTSSNDMFRDCTNLVGGQGTTYNESNPWDKTYAHIDGGTSNPGYFTEWKEAYACYTPSNTTLTFYYDSQRSGRTGTTYDLNTGANDTDWDTDGTNANVTWVVFDPSFANARPTTTYDWFFNMQNLQSITGMEYLNTSEVTKMAYMFMLCTSLTSLDVSHFNTSKVTDMNSMFCKCSSLTSLDLSSFNTSKVTKMGWMFSNCSNLRTIYVGSGWSTAAVTSSNDMFRDCTNLVGGQGTTYNESNPWDKAYAHIDGGPSNPGYFTDKNASLRGDVNGDGSVNISDVTALIDYLLTGNASGISLSGADCNQDGSINISDVAALIDRLLIGAW